MKSFSFIHAADLHLGSPFVGVAERQSAMAEALKAATFQAFEILIETCLEDPVDFLLVAGDVFDRAHGSVRAQLAFRDGLDKLSNHGIRTFVVFGNHDPREAWLRKLSWPEKVHIFSSRDVETEIVSKNGVPVATVSGISHPHQRELRNLSERFTAKRPDLFQIGLLHGNCGGQPGHDAYAPCTVEGLSEKGFDYWALGHVHTRKILKMDPHIVYPGCSQGLSIRETGARGCYRVMVDESQRVSQTFIMLDKVRWAAAGVSIEGVKTLDALEQALGAEAESMHQNGDGRLVIGRITLTGRGPLYKDLRRDDAVEALLLRLKQTGKTMKPTTWIIDLQVDCMPDMDLARRREADDLVGQLLRSADDLHPKKFTETALGALFENRRLRPYLSTLSPLDLQRLVQEAQRLCIDLLEPDS
ncbi:MAG: DNA repair exonuclease [Deltaproteobacteria bacterium]|nr:DNA repair exonuclease [Deltaproteobacteria bacterium]